MRDVQDRNVDMVIATSSAGKTGAGRMGVEEAVCSLLERSAGTRESDAAGRAQQVHVLPHKEGRTSWQELNGVKVLSLNGSCSRSTAARVPEKDGEVV